MGRLWSQQRRIEPASDVCALCAHRGGGGGPGLCLPEHGVPAAPGGDTLADDLAAVVHPDGKAAVAAKAPRSTMTGVAARAASWAAAGSGSSVKPSGTPQAR